MGNVRKAVAQEDAMGCGIACVAYVCGLSYRTAKQGIFEKPQYAGTKGYACRDLVRALAKADNSFGWSSIKHDIAIPISSIVFTARSEQYPAGHYLVKTRMGWMDPWINYPRLKAVRGGFRKRLPGRAAYLVYPKMSIEGENKRR
ncbi:MAG: hypothetical protein V1827_06165 [Candidatus Micrarchaeota archaeon]